ncbi:MAG TPA: RNA methyltransferase [Nitrososphaera sp.]|nr:RNA methyltransferase [Nitrososphaera sp.]
MAIAVALMEPQYPVNVGHVARLMKNFGLRTLHTINPQYESIEAVKYATHGSDILLSAKVLTLQQLRKKFDILIGTTAIKATSRLNVLRESITPEQMAKIIHDSAGKNFCIVLGRESSGLKNEELGICDLVCVIDTKTKYRTMNIAHALALMLYEISRLKPEVPIKKSKKTMDLASQEDIDLLMQYVDRVATLGNYDSHKKPLLDAAVKKMIARSVPTTKDVMLIVSLMRKSALAIERQKHC